MIFDIGLALVAVVAGSIASVAGFGIGSLITPLVALRTGTGVAVAAVSIAHFCGTSLRFLFWRKHVNKKVLFSFGITSAAGGLIGALLHTLLFNSALTIIFGCLLVFAGVIELTGLSGKVRFSGAVAWVAGGLSGLFGGLVGNQGGIRSAALLGFELERKEFVATATGIALAVDIARIPVYLAVQGKEIMAVWPLILIATVGVIFGTITGRSILKIIPERSFRKIVAVIILAIGIFVLIHG
jgi:uncharacterized membrane protein YfcA